MQGIAPKHILLIGSHVRLSRWPTNLAVSPINLLSTTSNSNDAWTPELDRPQADSYGHFLSTLNPSPTLFSDYHDVSANRTRHSYATLFTALVSMLLYFSRDLATPHFSKFCGQNFKLQLLTHFLMDFLKT